MNAAVRGFLGFVGEQEHFRHAYATGLCAVQRCGGEIAVKTAFWDFFRGADAESARAVSNTARLLSLVHFQTVLPGLTARGRR